MSVLKKIRIVEFADGVPGPLAALRLSDLGADVIKVESAEGDWLRNAAPALPGSEMSAALRNGAASAESAIASKAAGAAGCRTSPKTRS